MTQNYAKKVLGGFLWQGGAQAVGQAVSWLTTLLVIRLLTPEDYGLVAIATLFLGFFFMIADMGFGSAVVQSAELGKQQIRELFGIILLMNAASAGLMLVLAPAIAAFFHDPRLVLIIRVLSANFLLTALYTLPKALLVRELEFGRKARLDVTATVVSALAALGLALAGAGVWALVGSMVVLNVTRTILFLMFAPRLPLPSFAIRSVNPLARFGLIITLDRIAFYFYGQADVAIGGRVLGPEVLGLYTVALTLASLPMEKVLPVITQVSFAAYSRIQADAARVNRNLLRSLRLASTFVFPAFLGLAVVADEFVPLVLGDRWLPVIVPFKIICFVLPLKAMAALFPPALFAVGKPGVNLVNMLLTAMLMVVAFLVGVRWGAVGLAAAWLAAYPVAFTITSARAMRALDLDVGEVLQTTWIPAVASILMVLVVEILSGALGTHSIPVPMRLIAMVACGAVIYTATMLMWNRRSLEDLRFMFKA